MTHQNTENARLPKTIEKCNIKQLQINNTQVSIREHVAISSYKSDDDMVSLDELLDDQCAGFNISISLFRSLLSF